MVHFRARAAGIIIAAALLLSSFGRPPAIAAAEGRATVSAYLDGVPIPIGDIAKYYCDDFSYPVISCSTSALLEAVRTTTFSLLASVDYVTIYEQAGFAGAWMNVTQDYPLLSLIGWNDRISSFKARNSETGRFSVDWFFAGSGWSFCCNTQQGALGGYDNLFSSLQRT